MEGNTLLMETDLVINEGQTISGKSMRTFKTINHQEAIVFIKTGFKRMPFLMKLDTSHLF
jgi:hypothetical protein